MPGNISNTNRSLWPRRMLIAFVVALFSLAAAGLAYQSLASSRDRRAFLMPGQLIDIGGYKLHIDCTGSGSPTVILDSGLGDGYLSWRKVQPQIAVFTRVCSYDRAGEGYSDSSPRSRTSKIFAEELHALLHSAGVAPPYILVGHSMGGFDVRIYRSMWPKEVAGMVLVDSSHPEQQTRLPEAVNDLDKTWVREQEVLTFITPFGIPRLLGFCAKDLEARAAECNFHSEREALAELKSLPESALQTSETGSLGDLPLTVLSSDPERPEPDLPEDLVEPTHKAWQQMQEELAQLSTRIAHITARNSGHYIQLDRPDLVIDSIRKLVDQVRNEAVLQSR
jgi:pimeloyl-ACP methyl ester carboxylesterase